MNYNPVRFLLIALLGLGLGQGKAGNAKSLAAPSGVPNLKNPILKKNMAMPNSNFKNNPNSAPKKAASTSIRKPPARLVGKTLKSSVLPQIGITALPAGSSIKTLSADGQWILGSCDGYPAIFDLAGNVAKMTNVTNTFVPGPKNILTGMCIDGTVCGILQTASGTTAPTKAFYAQATVSSGSIQLPDPTLIPMDPAVYSGTSTTGNIGFFEPRICGTANTSTGSTVGYYYDVGAANIIPLETASGTNSTASCITADGSIIFGTTPTAMPTTSYRWWNLGIPGQSGYTVLDVKACSPNGNKIVGTFPLTTYPPVNSAARIGYITSSYQSTVLSYNSFLMTSFPFPTDSTAFSFSAENNMIGGTQTVSGSTKGFVCLQIGNNLGSGNYSVKDWLTLRGITFSSDADYAFADKAVSVNGINADGTLFVGNTMDGSSNPCGYIAYVGGGGGGGTPGPMGPQGPIGLTGATGAAGTNGIDGAQGPIGLTGAKGDKGDKGIQGPAGTPGGPAGATGATGARGLQGIRGLQGVPGTQGQTGAQGIQGYTGPQGVQGPKGDAGIQGPAGNPAVGLEKEDIVSKGSRSRLPQQD